MLLINPSCLDIKLLSLFCSMVKITFGLLAVLLYKTCVQTQVFYLSRSALIFIYFLTKHGMCHVISLADTKYKMQQTKLAHSVWSYSSLPYIRLFLRNRPLRFVVGMFMDEIMTLLNGVWWSEVLSCFIS
jgi:hypothetical protein